MIFFSASSVSGNNITQIIGGLVEAGVRHIELNGNNGFEPNIEGTLDRIRREYGIDFLIHNYFPAPEEAFVLNLASGNRDILERTIALSKKAIRLAAKLKVPVYSVHAGMCLDPQPKELGRPIKQANLIPYEEAYGIFIRSLSLLCDFAGDFNINIAVENHVLSPFNLRNGRNEVFLMCEADDFLRLFSDISKPNLKVLVDLGHVNVASATLGFDKIDFINKLEDRISVFHLHRNNGIEDFHEMINEQEWFWPVLGGFHGVRYVIESHNLTIEQIRLAKEVCQKMLA